MPRGYYSKDQPGGYPGLSLTPGTRNGTKFLRDDGTWQTPAGGGGAGNIDGGTPDSTYGGGTAIDGGGP